MKRQLLTAIAVVLGLALVPSVATAKGPSEVSIEGPGLSEGIPLPGHEVVEVAGFFPGVFRQTPDPMLSERPRGSLGPKYVMTYALPGPNGEEDVLRQDVYPYAKAQPVSYMRPGQRFFMDQQTHGGWFVAKPTLKRTLVAAGLPVRPPAVGDDSSFPWPVVATTTLLVALAVFAYGARTRRRQHPAGGQAEA